MADYIQPTPRNKLLGLLADGVQGVNDFAAAPFGYANPPGQMLMQMLGLPDIAKTADRMSYGESLTTGSGMTTKPRPEVMDGLLAAAPMAAGAGLLAAKAAPTVQRGLMAMGENAAIPSTLNKQAGVILYHGSNQTRPITNINDGGVFGGLFASPRQGAAESHGNALYRMTVPDEKVMGMGADVPWDLARGVTHGSILKGSQYGDEITDMALNARSAFSSSVPDSELMKALRVSDLGEADWALQRLRGEIGKKAGYKAVEMPDEHGTSYLVLPGTSPRPANDTAKLQFRSGQTLPAPIASPAPAPANSKLTFGSGISFDSWLNLDEAARKAAVPNVKLRRGMRPNELALFESYR